MIPCCESGTQRASTGLEVFLVLCRASEVRDSVSGLTSSPRTFLYGCRIKGKKIGIYDKNMSTIIKQIYAISYHNKRTRATLTWSVRTQLFGYNLGDRI